MGVSTFLKQCPRSAIAEQFSYLLVSAISLVFLSACGLLSTYPRVKVKECCIFICFCCNCEGLNLELSYGQIDDKEPPKVVNKGKSSLESLHACPI